MMTTTLEETIIYRVKDLMRILKIGRDRAYALMRSKGFPSTQIGRTFFIAKKNFDSWVEQYAGREYLI